MHIFLILKNLTNIYVHFSRSLVLLKMTYLVSSSFSLHLFIYLFITWKAENAILVCDPCSSKNLKAKNWVFTYQNDLSPSPLPTLN